MWLTRSTSGCIQVFTGRRPGGILPSIKYSRRYITYAGGEIRMTKVLARRTFPRGHHSLRIREPHGHDPARGLMPCDFCFYRVELPPRS